MDIVSAITLVSALVGMVTGIVGLWLSLANRRYQIRTATPRLRLIPELAFPGPADEMINETFFSERVEHALRSLKTYACVRLTNLGVQPLSVFEVGFLADENQIPWRSPDCVWVNPNDVYRDSSYVDKLNPFPLVIPPDETISVYLRVRPNRQDSLHSILYAKIDTGQTFSGTSPIIHDTIEWLNCNAKNAA